MRNNRATCVFRNLLELFAFPFYHKRPTAHNRLSAGVSEDGFNSLILSSDSTRTSSAPPACASALPMPTRPKRHPHLRPIARRYRRQSAPPPAVFPHAFIELCGILPLDAELGERPNSCIEGAMTQPLKARPADSRRNPLRPVAARELHSVVAIFDTHEGAEKGVKRRSAQRWR